MTEKTTATKTALEAVPKTIQFAKPEEMFDRLERIYDRIARRAFEIFEGNGKSTGRELDDWFQAEAELLHPVKINLTETERGLTVQAEVPGFSEKDLEVRVEPTRLTISGKRETTEKREKGKTVCQEYQTNELLRFVDLPVEVQQDNAVATLKNGVLEVELPKAVKAAGKKVAVKAA